MVLAVLRVIFGHEDGHVFPERAVREQLHQLAQRQVVIRHVGSTIGESILRARVGGMIVREPDVDELWQRFLAAYEFIEFFPELGEAILVGDVGIEGWIVMRGVIEQDLRHWHIHGLPRAGGILTRTFVVARQFQSFAIIAEGKMSPRQVFPQRTVFKVSLGNCG